MGSKTRRETQRFPHSTSLKKHKEYSTVTARLETSDPQSLPTPSGSQELKVNLKINHALSDILKTESWRSWDAGQQRQFWECVKTQKVPIPSFKPRDLETDPKESNLNRPSSTEFSNYLYKQIQVDNLRIQSRRFREQNTKEKAHVEMERNRRKLMGILEGNRMGIYEGDPDWDDVIPIPQEESESALAAIAYTEEYSEAMSYLRAVMAAKEHSMRVLALTAHVIKLNPAHYTVWLYRASTIMTLNLSIHKELEWLNEIALQNPKNYQIWHHRQLLIDHLYLNIADDDCAKKELASSEAEFMKKMFDEDSKNYHVWSYRQYFVRKLQLFNCNELSSIEILLDRDIRNNSAWCHRFFIVFSNPDYTSTPTTPFEYDPKIPHDIIEREKEFARASILKAPQNSCPWNYLRGVLKKGGQTVLSEEEWATNFAILGEVGCEECKLITSSHALELLADIWTEKKENDKADEALRLLGDKYDRIRKNYWDWKRRNLKNI